ncbi:BadF/BadG/BcrA/BcrD ATPase family protein [Ruegeria sp. HKCCA6837]|uniref:BadF/BadG/BcrA/BcrD ATPase family protein n=1 Tax=Ruegeria sp. HKCCA6837 TaxID=2682989 RepID=UPI001489CC42|nr:BadF/BadG/BcrA/BcrD ATPase family protein [Ruegeria sp. HKCCA6837]
MTSSSGNLILAIDGGGTRCRLALLNGAQTWRVEVGSANVSTDFETSCAELVSGLAVLCKQAGIELAEIARAPAYVGLAGVTGQAIADRLAAALPFARVRIEDDRPSALRGALGPRDGFVAHCGTGSFLAAQRSGATVFVGGWGPVLGDQASAQWVGKRALSEVLECADGMRAASEMSEHLLRQFNGTSGVVKAASMMTPTEFGALAPVVTQFAGQGDTVAQSIMQAGADYLADRLVKMGWSPGAAICLTGGIGPYYSTFLPEDMQQALVQPSGDPLSGAIALAQAFKEEIEHERC